MSQLPEVTITVQDGGLGIIPNTAGNVEVTVGLATGAIPNTLYSFGDLQTMQSVLGYGPGAEACALKLALGGAGNPQLFISPTPNYDGAVTAVTHVGTGFGVVTTGFGPLQQITIRVQTVGTLGTMKFTYQLGTGPISSPVATTATPFGPYTVPGTMTQLTFADGGGAWVAGEVATIATTGVVTITTNTNSNTLTQASQPADTYPVTITPSTSGGYNYVPVPQTISGGKGGTTSPTGSFTYGLDLDPVALTPYTNSATTQLPPSGNFAIPNSGIVAKFAQQTIAIDIHTAGGALGTMKFRVNLAGGGLGADQLSIAGVNGYDFTVPGSNYVLHFANGTYNVGVTYSWDAQGNFTMAGGVTADNLVSLTSTEFPVGDTYSFQTAASTYADPTSTITALLLLPNPYSFIHVVGTPVSAAAADTLAGILDSLLISASSSFKFLRGLVECPTVGTIFNGGGSVVTVDSADTDSVLSSTFNNFVSLRVGVGAGDAIVTSLLSGRQLRRNAAWLACARVAQVAVSEDLAYVGRGALPFTRYLFRDEAKTPALDAARFTTLRTYQGQSGYFITNGRLMAQSTSDFSLIQYGRVMDVACQITRSGLLPFLSGKVRINASTGFINEKDAQTIEKQIVSQLNAGLVAPGNASAAFVTLSRNTNLLSTGAEPVTVRILSLAYLKQLAATLGFFNPALSQ